MLRGTEAERKNNTRSQGEEGTIWPGWFLRSPQGDEPNISFWVLRDAELTYSSLKAAQLSVFRLFVSSSLSSSCPLHHFLLTFLFWTLAALFFFFFDMADVPCRVQNKFYIKNELRLRVISSSFWHSSLLVFDEEIVAFFKMYSKCQML